MKDFKYKTIFSSKIKPLVPEDKDKYLALASLIDVGSFIPDIDTDTNVDLLPVAFNAFVVNRVNKNDDVIDSSVALDIFKSFINKPINVEHNRDRVIGTILTAGFSEFGTDRPLSEEEVSEMKGPFNVTLGGVIWRVVNSGLTDMIEEASDPTSPNYMGISASWELGFSDYEIVILKENEKNIENSTIISEDTEVKAMEENLRAFGGTGELEDGNRIYRKVVNDVVPLGIGLTENPAADVKGVAVKAKEEEELDTVKEDEKITKNSEENISQLTNNNVKNNTGNRVIMKINSIQDITDESLSQLKASAITDFIEESLKEASEEFTQEKSKDETAIKETNEKYDSLVVESDAQKTELEKVQKSLEQLEAEKLERETDEQFNQRMAVIDDKYNLDDEDRKVLASQVKDLDEEGYEAYTKQLEVLLRSKDKETLSKQKEESEVKTAEVEASEETNEVVEEAINEADVQTAEIPASTDASEQTVYDKYKSAFEIDNFDIRK
jgi:hypothetical protein